MGRRAVSREDSAARLRALTRRAYTASEGYLDLDDDAGREFDRIVEGDDPGRRTPPQARRWAVSLRAAVVVLAVVAVLTGVVVLRSLAAGSVPVPVPELAAPGAADPAREDASGPDSLGPAGEAGGTPADDDGSRRGTAAHVGTAEAEGTAAGESDGSAGPSAAAGAGPPAVVTVHVAGAVTAPGVVELTEGARVAHALEAAGGASPQAELAAINLARPVQDGEQVYVPTVGEALPGSAAGPAAAAGPGPGVSGAPAGTDAPPTVVDLNTADAVELDSLPGVGPAIAQRILDWRAANGPFHSVDELLEVSGIGPATLERLRDRVRV